MSQESIQQLVDKYAEAYVLEGRAQVRQYLTDALTEFAQLRPSGGVENYKRPTSEEVEKVWWSAPDEGIISGRLGLVLHFLDQQAAAFEQERAKGGTGEVVRMTEAGSFPIWAQDGLLAVQNEILRRNAAAFAVNVEAIKEAQRKECAEAWRNVSPEMPIAELDKIQLGVGCSVTARMVYNAILNAGKSKPVAAVCEKKWCKSDCPNPMRYDKTEGWKYGHGTGRVLLGFNPSPFCQFCGAPRPEEPTK
jgi:hypothetical protein